MDWKYWRISMLDVLDAPIIGRISSLYKITTDYYCPCMHVTSLYFQKLLLDETFPFIYKRQKIPDVYSETILFRYSYICSDFLYVQSQTTLKSDKICLIIKNYFFLPMQSDILKIHEVYTSYRCVTYVLKFKFTIC